MGDEFRKYKICFFEIKPHEIEFFKKELEGHELSFIEQPLTIENVGQCSEAEIISVFVNSKVDRETLDKLSSLQFIATRSTGYDHIDINHCNLKRAKVSNVPAYGSNTVAEYAMALLLNLSRKINHTATRVRNVNFDVDGLTGFDLQDKTVGVIGTGKIGKNFIRMARGFEMKILAYDICPDPVYASEHEFQYTDLTHLVQNSDVISLHLPLLDSTKHIINVDTIKNMKDGVVLINVSRGGLIDTNALYDAVITGKIGALGMDAIEGESLLKVALRKTLDEIDEQFDYQEAFKTLALANLPNVIVTPHNAFNSTEALNNILQTTVENIKCFIEGGCENNVAEYFN